MPQTENVLISREVKSRIAKLVCENAHSHSNGGTMTTELLTTDGQKIHAAHCTYTTSDGKVSVHWFASVDGENWVEVSNDARVASLAEIRRCVGLSADGTKHVRYPMTFTRGYLVHRLAATFLTGEKHA